MNTYHPYYLLLFHPLPTTWYSPLSQGEKVGARVLQEHCGYNFTSRQQTVPLRQGANEVFREMTKCHFVPHEGSTTQCDAGPAREHSDGGGGLIQKSK